MKPCSQKEHISTQSHSYLTYHHIPTFLHVHLVEPGFHLEKAIDKEDTSPVAFNNLLERNFMNDITVAFPFSDNSFSAPSLWAGNIHPFPMLPSRVTGP